MMAENPNVTQARARLSKAADQISKCAMYGHEVAKEWRSVRYQEKPDPRVRALMKEWPELFEALEKLGREGDLGSLGR